ncbi:MAG TPA: hypothetical protein VGG74_19325 [Kofleriaceae bacterium]
MDRSADAPTLQADNTPPVAASDFQAELESALCQLWVNCGVYEDLDACEVANPATVSWEAAQRLADLADGRMQYEGSRAADCINRVASASCSDTSLSSTAGALGLLLADCDLFVLGTIPDGGACNHGEECGANSACLPDPAGPSSGQCLAGTCTHVDNRICGTGNPPCPNDEVCLAGGVCGGTGKAGDACNLDDDCGKGLVCAGTVDAYGPTGSGMCVAATATGGPCIEGECALGETCITTSLTDLNEPITQCVANVDRGQPCSSPGEIISIGACKDDSVCDVETHTCIAMPATGESDAPVCD